MSDEDIIGILKPYEPGSFRAPPLFNAVPVAISVGMAPPPIRRG